jgi:hypothetical protein
MLRSIPRRRPTAAAGAGPGILRENSSRRPGAAERGAMSPPVSVLSRDGFLYAGAAPRVPDPRDRAGGRRPVSPKVPDLQGVLAHGETQEQTVAHAQALALRVLADAWNTPSPRPICCRWILRRLSAPPAREHVDRGEGAARPGYPARDRVAPEARGELAQGVRAGGVAGFVFASRTARRSGRACSLAWPRRAGLRPEDL